MVIQFRVDGIPKGQPRVKARNMGRHAGVYTPATANGWKDCVALAAREVRPAEPLLGPIYFEMTLIFPRPNGHFVAGDPTRELKKNAPNLYDKKPDRDNGEKGVTDRLTQVGMWKDDCQICDGPVRKRYCKIGERPGAEITIAQLDPITGERI